MSATAERHARLRARMAAAPAPEVWRSLEELSGSGALRDFVADEFPNLGHLFDNGYDRRTILKLMGGALMMGGLAACREPEDIVPYVRQPENVVPGKPRYFATTLALDGQGVGVIAESHEGRPTKLEGNPDHPASLGAADAVLQASVLDLYDPGRSRSVLKDGEPAGYDRLLVEIADMRETLHANRGRALALLLGPDASPTLARQVEELRAQFPAMRTYLHDPLAGEGRAQAMGQAVQPVYRLATASAVLSLDDDFLGEGAGRLAYARAFADRRRVREGTAEMLRLYAVASLPTLTTANADHHRTVRAGAMEQVAEALAARLEGREPPATPLGDAFLDAVADDLRQAGRRALVTGGAHQTARLHALVHRINSRLGAFGSTLDHIAPIMPAGADAGTLADLVGDIAAGEVTALAVLGCDPVHSAPGDLDVAAALGSVPWVLHWGLYRDETARHATWHVPATHALESWSDLAAFDGTASITQPLIEPLYGGHGLHEIVAALAGDFASDAHQIVRETWRERGLAEADWRLVLKQGVVPGTAAESLPPVTIDPATFPPAEMGGGVELRFEPDPWFRDGRHAANVWLMELPRPLTKLVWGNAAQISPALAGGLGVETGDLLRIELEGRELVVPAWIEPGQQDDSVTLPLGFGRETGSGLGSFGFNAFRLATSSAPWFADGASIAPAGGSERLITTQEHHSMAGRGIVRFASLPAFVEDPSLGHGKDRPEESLYPDWKYDDAAWGMSIDQSACIGCMACVSACQAENNIPTVGPDEAAQGHEMHWLRVDRYYAGDPARPETLFQPVPCMQCEKAPCEPVCPVNATVHTHEGLNAQVYNRCVGTRYCSQNCPYKVRRFNFLEYQPFDEGHESPLSALMNPDVSVRSRGVMEKCTYCVQRIKAAEIEAEVQGREVRDGEVRTACQQTCPTQAISFGDLNRPDSSVRQLKRQPHDHVLLAELNTRPRTSYLARITNPNPALDDEVEEGSDG